MDEGEDIMKKRTDMKTLRKSVVLTADGRSRNAKVLFEITSNEMAPWRAIKCEIGRMDGDMHIRFPAGIGGAGRREELSVIVGFGMYTGLLELAILRNPMPEPDDSESMAAACREVEEITIPLEKEMTVAYPDSKKATENK